MATFTYPEVGATREGALPAGYQHLTYRTRLGPGVLRPAAEAVLTWRMHRGTGVRLDASAPRAAPGVRVTSRIAGISAPCQVVWTVDEEDQAGFGYGTLAGHPASGEESFVVSRDGDGEVWFTVTSFSRAARWYTRAAGPVVPLLQRAFARRCGSALRKSF
jgi:uncharacterized protein (UPF0548 family)